jgi:WD40 repeat protein
VASFSPDGRHIATALDRTIRVWPTGPPPEPIVLRGHERAITRAEFSSDGARVLTSSLDGTVRSWRLEDPARPVVLNTGERSLPSAVYSSDGGRIAAIANRESQGGVLLARADGEGQTRREAPLPLYEPAFSPDSTRMAVAATNDVVYVFELDGSGAFSTILPEQAPPADRRSREGFGLAFSPDGTELALPAADFTIRIRPVQAGSGPRLVLRGHSGSVRHLSFSRDGGRIRTASTDGTWRIWDVRSGQTVQTGKTDGGFATFSADGGKLVAVTADGARISSLVDRSASIVVRGHEGAVLAAALSADGRRVVTASADRTARVWTIDWRELIARLRASTTSCLTPAERIEILEESAAEAAVHSAGCDRVSGRRSQQ